MKNYLEQAKQRLQNLEREISSRTHDGFDSLKDKQRVARERLTALEGTNKDRWDIVRQGFEDAWHELEAAYLAVRDDVKSERQEASPSERSTHP